MKIFAIEKPILEYNSLIGEQTMINSIFIGCDVNAIGIQFYFIPEIFHMKIVCCSKKLSQCVFACNLSHVSEAVLGSVNNLTLCMISSITD